MAHDTRLRKVCFVTIGATASFDSLIHAVLDSAFLETLRDSAYTDLRIQHGAEGAKIFMDYMIQHGNSVNEQLRVKVTGFDFDTQGLGVEMQAAKGAEGALEGVVISHAGMMRWNYL